MPSPRSEAGATPAILTDNMVGSGVHLNAVGVDCPGKTELHRDILLRSDIFVGYPPQIRIEGEIQQLTADHPVTELWRAITCTALGRADARQVTLFDSVGFATEDFSALRYVHDRIKERCTMRPSIFSRIRTNHPTFTESF